MDISLTCLKTSIHCAKTSLEGSVSHNVKDRHQWLGRELQCLLSWCVDKLFSKAIIYIVYR